MQSLLPELRLKDWREAAQALFNGTGSYGNGGAMRVAPVGAYFADDLSAVVENAELSARVTHAHPEGVAGAVAVAIAAALAAQARETGDFPEPTAYLNSILEYLPKSAVRDRTEIVRDMGEDVIGETVAEMVGSGENIAAEDTVPFCLWCAAQHLKHYDEAIWLTLTGLGDRDTTCAIVGGIVGAATGVAGIPEEWLANREPLDL
jgi:ADP-ribosylglycohydrolase